MPSTPTFSRGVVHHREHRGHALARAIDHPAGRALETRDAGGRAVQAHLVFERDDLEAVGHARVAVFIGDVFRHHEQADALGPGHRGQQSGASTRWQTFAVRSESPQLM